MSLEAKTAIIEHLGRQHPNGVFGDCMAARISGGRQPTDRVDGSPTAPPRGGRSGAAHAQGVSAIEALARKVERLHRLTDHDLGHDDQCRAGSKRHCGQYRRRPRHRGDR